MSDIKETLDDLLANSPYEEVSKFAENLDLSIEELLKKSIDENWQLKHVEFWIKVKNARNFERLVAAIEAL